jgi:hypothetical protein
MSPLLVKCFLDNAVGGFEMTTRFEERLPQVRVTRALKEALEAKAQKHNIRLNDAIRQAIVNYVNAVRVPIVGEIRPGSDGNFVVIKYRGE